MNTFDNTEKSANSANTQFSSDQYFSAEHENDNKEIPTYNPTNPQSGNWNFQQPSSTTQTSVTLSKTDAYGILGLMFAYFFPIVGIFVSRSAWKNGEQQNNEFASTLGKWGFWISAVFLALFVLYFVLFISIFAFGILAIPSAQ